MALRVCLLLALLALAKAQSTPDGMGFDAQLAADTRNLHFYCLERGQTPGNFPKDIPLENGMGIQAFARWTVFLQYPVLSYLDSMRKPALINSIAEIVNRPVEEFCIATVENYRISYYDESVLVSFYFLDTPGDPTSVVKDSAEIMRINGAFQDVVKSGDNGYVRSFQGRTAIIVNTTNSGLPNQNIHPGAVMETYDATQDPTLNAVILASFPGNVTLEYVLSQRENWIQDFADNPNPRSLGLEAGDIVFAVFGSIFLIILSLAIVMGYCIHPFFLA